jgi:hypothetical protein
MQIRNAPLIVAIALLSVSTLAATFLAVSYHHRVVTLADSNDALQSELARAQVRLSGLRYARTAADDESTELPLPDRTRVASSDVVVAPPALEVPADTDASPAPPAPAVTLTEVPRDNPQQPADRRARWQNRLEELRQNDPERYAEIMKSST